MERHGPQALVFSGTLDGLDVDLIELAGLDLTDWEEAALWRVTSPYYLLEECVHLAKKSVGESDRPGLGDEHFEYSISASDRTRFGDELKETILLRLIDGIVTQAQLGVTQPELSDDLVETWIGQHEDVWCACDMRPLADTSEINFWAEGYGYAVEDSISWRADRLREIVEHTIEGDTPRMLELHVLTSSSGKTCLLVGEYAAAEVQVSPYETFGAYPDKETMDKDFLERGIITSDRLKELPEDYFLRWLSARN